MILDQDPELKFQMLIDLRNNLVDYRAPSRSDSQKARWRSELGEFA